MLKIVILLYGLNFFHNVHAQFVDLSLFLIKEEKVGERTSLYFDFNQDRKVDQVTVFHNLFKESEKIDYNFDGKFDQFSTWFPITDDNSHFKKLEYDTNYDGRLDFIKNYSVGIIDKKKMVQTFVAIDDNFDGTMDFISRDAILYDQYQLLRCNSSELRGFEFIQKLKDDTDKIVWKVHQDYIFTNYNYKIHSTCFEKWGRRRFYDIATTALTKGAQCLLNLQVKAAQKNPKIVTGALRNLVGLQTLLKKKPVTLVCNERDYNWNGIRAHASTEASDKIEGLDISHPFISLHPVLFVPKPGTAQKKQDQKLISTIFHESLHNLGFKHGDEIEYSYACQSCCFPDENAFGQKEGCKICTGNYKNSRDPKYIDDLVDWGVASVNISVPVPMVAKNLKKKARNRTSLIQWIRLNSGIFDPVGIEMAKLLLKKDQTLSLAQKDLLTQALKNQNLSDVKAALPVAKKIAEAYYELYYEHNPEGALKILKNLGPQLKKINKDKGNTNLGNRAYIAEGMSDISSDIIFEIWINEFSGKNLASRSKERSDQAYLIHEEAGF